jgi:hypothetical protein
MLIRFLKSNNASALLLLPFIAVLIWSFGFFPALPFQVKHTMPLYQLVAGLLVNLPWLEVVIACLLLVMQAFLLNYIVNENEILSKQTYLPALFYILLMSNNNDMLVLHPLLFANFFMLFAISKLLSSYRKDKAFSQSFDAGILISIATLFYFPYLLFFPLLGVGLIVIRPFNWREWVISFLGVLTPYLFVFTFYFWNDSLDYLFYDYMFYGFLYPKAVTVYPSGFYYISGLILVILSFSIINIFQGVGMGVQKTKNAIVLLFWFLLFAILAGFIAPESSTKYFSGIAIPAAVFYANYFANIKKQWWAEFLGLLLILSIIFNLIVHFF